MAIHQVNSIKHPILAPNSFYSSLLDASVFCRNHGKMVQDGNLIHDMIVGSLDPKALIGFERVSSMENSNQLVLMGEEILNIDPLDMRERGDDTRVFRGSCTPRRKTRGDVNFFLQGVAKRNEEFLLSWVVSKLEDFGPFLGFSFEGFEKEVVELFRLIERKRGMCHDVVDPNSVVGKKLRRELKKLESGVNYDKKIRRVL